MLLSARTVTTDLRNRPLKVNFKDDTLTTVSRDKLKEIANRLGFNETQTVLFALARLRDEVLVEQEDAPFAPLTRAHHLAIAEAEPKERGTVLSTLF